MALELRWVGYEDLDRVALTRLRCFGSGEGELDRFRELVRSDRRQQDGDFLLAEEDGQAVGTATSLSMTMWMRGAPLACQGVAWVGAVRTHRRRSASNQPGVASTVMREMLHKARQRHQVVSALMPFRVSFYQHFGYGVVERLCEWTIPLSILPSGDTTGMRFFRPDDLPQIQALHQRIVQRGQCDLERPPAAWENQQRNWPGGFVIVDQPPGRPIQGWMSLQQVARDGRQCAQVTEIDFETTEALRRLLAFLAGLKDQCSLATLVLPADLPIHRLLGEPQIAHRPIEHPAPQVRPCTRMQLRVLDHRHLLQAMHYPPEAVGLIAVAVHETEGHISRFAIDIADGQAQVRPTEASPQVSCSDRTWAAIVSGDLRASTAAALDLIEVADPQALPVLDAFAAGPVPFCREPF